MCSCTTAAASAAPSPAPATTTTATTDVPPRQQRPWGPNVGLQQGSALASVVSVYRNNLWQRIPKLLLVEVSERGLSLSTHIKYHIPGTTVYVHRMACKEVFKAEITKNERKKRSCSSESVAKKKEKYRTTVRTTTPRNLRYDVTLCLQANKKKEEGPYDKIDVRHKN